MNNHPHASADGKYVLVHNGIVPKHEQLADEFCLRLQTRCDSELLVELVAAAPRPAEGLADCLRACRSSGGSMAVAVLDIAHNLVWLCRDADRPLWLCRLIGSRCWLFASTAEIILTALAQVYGRDSQSRLETLMPLAPGYPHALTASGKLITSFTGPVH